MHQQYRKSTDGNTIWRRCNRPCSGTGRTHNWNLSRQIVEAVDVTVFLAGGIDAGNVRKAIDVVGPFGIDLCSGVRTDDRLDPKKLAAFFTAINS